MANTFTNILPVLAKAAQTVSRESCGFTKSITLDASPEGGNLGQTVNVPKSPAATAASWTPSLAPALGDTTATGVQLTLSNAYEVKWHVTAEQEAAMNGGAANAMSWFERQAAQAMRTLSNQVEAYLFSLAYKASSRATGSAGTTPFASNLDSFAALAEILNKNGAPMADRRLVCDPAAYREMQERFASVTSTKAGFSGELPPVSGIIPVLSNQVTTHTAGTGTGYLLNKSPSIGLGETTVPVDTGSGTVLAGDVILMGTGGLMYVVKTALTGGNIVINDPGIVAVKNNNTVITRQASYTPNVCLTPDAIYGVIRAPKQPTELPNGWAHEIVSDAVSGIPFGVLRIPGDGVVHYSARVLYGAVVVESAHIATLMG